MFTKQIAKSFPALFAAAVSSAIAISTPAQAAEPVEHAPSVMNQSNTVYEATLKFYLHPARLEVTEPTHEMMDHPAVIVARRKDAGFDWTSAFILHPARLAVISEPSESTIDESATSVAKTKTAPSDASTKVTLHRPNAAKPIPVPYVTTTQFTSSTDK